MSVIASDSIQLESIKDVYDTAEGANTTASATAEHFWTDSDGAHVTEVTQTEWTDISDPNYHSGGNTLITTTGMEVRDGITTLASFGSMGAQVGQSGSGHTNISAGGLAVYGHDGTALLANIGYGSGNDDQGGTANAPFYSIGSRIGAIGNWSVAEGMGSTASGYSSHAEAGGLASGTNAHSEGGTAYGYHSHSEGYSNARGDYSHAEGYQAVALNDYSHAQNYYTLAESNYQTALGKYNTADYNDKYAVIIGNGTAENARSNALTVAWNGDVTTTGTITVGSAPTSNMEVATKKYVDDNSGGGGWTPTFETIRNGISITTTSTNYGTNSISLSDYKYIELRLYNSSSMSSNIYPIETVKAQVNNVYINHGQVCRLGSSNVYLTWKYNDDTHLQMNINSGSNMYVGIFGIK